MANQQIVEQSEQLKAQAESALPTAQQNQELARVATTAAQNKAQDALIALNEARAKRNAATDPETRAALQQEVNSLQASLDIDYANLSSAEAALTQATNEVNNLENQITIANEQIESGEAAPPGGQGTIPVAVASPINFDPPIAIDYQVPTTLTEDQAADIVNQIQSDEQDTVLDAIIEGNEQDRVLNEIIESNEQDTVLDAIIEGNEQDRVLDEIIQSNNGQKGTTSAEKKAQTSATGQDQVNFATNRDWRVKLKLAPGTGPNDQYLYKSNNPGILQPLQDSDGIIFPYTPNISIAYAANYEPTELIHSNYKSFFYRNSSVDNISISCDFTAQDTYEANYLLAVIHFLRSVTKMFYGQDQNPGPGLPPPLCYLTGLGAFQFDNHPLAITNFSYSLPTDVDYIRSSAFITALAGTNQGPSKSANNTDSQGRLPPTINTGGIAPSPSFRRPSGGTVEPTYVPTKMNIQISAIPIVSRNDVSNNFSLKDYATGKLLQSNMRKRAGFW